MNIRLFNAQLGRVAKVNMVNGVVQIRDLEAPTDQDPHSYQMDDPEQYIENLESCGWVVRR